jgi:hypothetical protein
MATTLPVAIPCNRVFVRTKTMSRTFVQATEKTSVVALMAVNDILVQATIRMSERAMGRQPGRARESAKNAARHLPRTIKDAKPAPGAGRPSVRRGGLCQMRERRGVAPSQAAGGREGEQRAVRALRPGAPLRATVANKAWALDRRSQWAVGPRAGTAKRSPRGGVADHGKCRFAITENVGSA